ncbi:MAG TPA: S9 family peptidase [Ktedonobacterales bacterium]|nr:S9 family peptidase [Ktedonobacterales bacterium]
MTQHDAASQLTTQPTTAATTERKPITPEMMATLRTANDPALSPDGKRVAYTLSEWAPGQQRRRMSVWTVSATETKKEAKEPKEPRVFAASDKNDYGARWSPDGQWLAFLSNREEEGGFHKAQLYVAPAQGGSARRLCAMPNGVSDLAWSPDGQRLAFTTLEGPEPAANPIVVTPGRHTRLWTVPTAGGQPEPVTPDNLTIWDFAWSPDGASFALYFGDGPDETDWYRGQVGVVESGGGAVRQLTRLTRQAAALAWSPDSARIAYVSGEWSDHGLVGGDVFVIPAAGGEARNLTPGVGFSPSWVQWLPDGQRLLYCGWDGLAGQIGLLDEASGALTTLQQEVIVNQNGWPRLSATADGRTFATIKSGPSHPAEVYMGALSDDAASAEGSETSGEISWRRLTRLNPLAEETWARVSAQRLTYQGADGWEIQALYTPPLHHEGTGAPPMILVVHGGPTSAHLDDFGGWVVQSLASAGFATLRPNPRGSIGRGVAFADAVLGDMGGKDYEDLMRGVDEAVARGLADPERLGIAGWSYGGFMTAWAVTQTTRFKAAMMGAGICDFHSFHAQTNIQDWDERFLRATPNEQPEVYRERSAITHVKRATTPTLIIHGEKDPCVPVNQAYAFYHALREQGAPVELAVYPGEGHGFVERDHIAEWVGRMIRWMTTYLRG